MKLRTALAALAAAVGCGTEPELPAPFPEDYAASHQQVRSCRLSLEHSLVYVRVLASPEALAAYNDRTPFPPGAVVLKEQYADFDQLCSGPVQTFTVMTKRDPGSATSQLDWDWAKVGNDFRVIRTDVPGCVRCHSVCGQPPDGYDGTCTVP